MAPTHCLMAFDRGQKIYLMHNYHSLEDQNSKCLGLKRSSQLFLVDLIDLENVSFVVQVFNTTAMCEFEYEVNL